MLDIMQLQILELIIRNSNSLSNLNNIYEIFFKWKLRVVFVYLIPKKMCMSDGISSSTYLNYNKYAHAYVYENKVQNN